MSTARKRGYYWVRYNSPGWEIAYNFGVVDSIDIEHPWRRFGFEEGRLEDRDFEEIGEWIAPPGKQSPPASLIELQVCRAIQASEL
jgi:hypothetical protein